MKLQESYQSASGDEKSNIKEQMIAVASARQQALFEAIKTDPMEVLQATIPSDVQAKMPAEVSQLLEQKQQLEGDVEAIHEDYVDGTDKYRFFLKTANNDRYELHFMGKMPQLLSGTHIKAKGTLIKKADISSDDTIGAMALDSSDQGITVLASTTNITSSTGMTTIIDPDRPYSMGVKKTLVILVNFQALTDQPYTKQQAYDLVFGQVSDFFMENSFGQMSLSGIVAGWYTIALDITKCDYSSISNLANEAARQDGVVTSGYDRHIYVFPKIPGCSWYGLAGMGGNPGGVWINGHFNIQTVAHELGHNFGLYHSRSADCGSSSIGNDCAISQYGDVFDTMGNRNAGHYNAYQKLRLGWLPSLLTVDSPGTYALEPYETTPGTRPKALRIYKGIDPSTGEKTWYYVEYRQPIGFDNFPYVINYAQNGVIIHTATDNVGNSSQLLDMTPNSGVSEDFADSALVTGKSFTDSNAGVTISVVSNDSTGAVVNISVDPLACIVSAPTISFSPKISDSVNAGTTVNYTMTIKNNDGSNCSNGIFNLSDNAPSGWTTSFSSNTLTLAPGASATTMISLASPSSTTDGYKYIYINAAHNNSTISDYVTYSVRNSTTTTNSAPIANNDSASTTANTAVTINVLANDSDPDGDALSVSSVSGVNGTATININGSIAFTPAKDFVGTEVFSYIISDGRGATATANVTVTVNAPPDTTAPAVSLTSPSSGQTVSGTISISASASDNVAVSKVEFRVDGKFLSSDSTSPYSASIDTTTLANGLHKISALATDSSGNSSTLAEMSVNVSNIVIDTTAPTVSITSPVDGEIVASKSMITITASASDNVKVSRVDFYVNGTFICSDTTSTYSCTYSVPGGKIKSFTVEAKAFDSSGNSASDLIQISSGSSTSTGGGGGGKGNGKGATN